MTRKQMERIKRKVLEAAGGPVPLAAHLGITRHAIYQWDRVPAERLGQVMEVTGLEAHEIRPDLFKVQATA